MLHRDTTVAELENHMANINSLSVENHRCNGQRYWSCAVVLLAALASSSVACSGCKDAGAGGGGGSGGERPIRQFGQRSIPQTQQPSWAEGEDCRRTDLTPPPSNLSKIKVEGNNWVCAPPGH
jgi:hypothetical protein